MSFANYLALLRDEISTAEYVDRTNREVAAKHKKPATFTLRLRWWIAAFLVGIAIWIAAGFVVYSMAFGASTHCESKQCLRHAIQWQRHDRARLERELHAKLAPQVELGYALAQGLYHVDLRRLGYCESNNNPFARTGQFISITQQGDNFRARNEDVYRLVSPWNPIASILVAARHIARYGSSEWQCRLDGSVKHGGAYS